MIAKTKAVEKKATTEAKPSNSAVKAAATVKLVNIAAKAKATKANKDSLKSGKNPSKIKQDASQRGLTQTTEPKKSKKAR